MKKTGIAALLALTVVAVAVVADQPAAAPAAPKMDPEACMKRCKEMGEAKAKMAAKHDAAWKQIETDLATAKKSTGEKKVAALESVVEKLVALHGEMNQAGTAHAAMASMDGHGMDCCAGKGEAAMASMSGKMMDCCAGEGHHAAGMAGCDHEAPAAAAAPAKK
jgi:Spy/CpxP family protein refolding chaperone